MRLLKKLRKKKAVTLANQDHTVDRSLEYHVLRRENETELFELVLVHYLDLKQGEYFVEQKKDRKLHLCMYKKEYLINDTTLSTEVPNHRIHIKDDLIYEIMKSYEIKLSPMDNLGMRK